jgi:hypothetical protein
MFTNNIKVQLKDIVAKQLPEFVRDNYPTFVAFVEAYYEFLDANEVDLRKTKDIDLTLDDFIQYFKKELAHNYPANVDNPRFLMKHIRDQYLAKGSEASYRLLFRLLYGKEINMDYPGKSMLRVSDGRWKQDVSVFVRVEAGNTAEVVGKSVDVQTSRKLYRTELNPTTQKLTKVSVNIESAVLLDANENLWEVFLDRNFYGDINPGDVIKYGSIYQAVVLPVSSKLKIQNKGQGFKPGMVFQVSSGKGTPIWFKVTSIDSNGGLNNIDIIKFGLHYDTDFSITTLPSSAVKTTKKIERQISSITYSKTKGTIGAINVIEGGYGYTQVPEVVVGGNGSGATAHAVLVGGVVTEIIIDDPGEGYTTAFVNIIPQIGDVGSGASGEVITGDSYSYSTPDKTNGFNELGYINAGDYWDYNFSDGAYVGTIIRQFYLDAKDAIAGNPALINVTLGALAKYPGYYKTNDGFLDDAMFIQDSYYYQAFSYVIRIDEQLNSYAAAVRSMLHPSGMALFGEYSVNNKFDLSVALEVMVKSLGITSYDSFVMQDSQTVYFYKDVSDAMVLPTGHSSIDDSLIVFDIAKSLVDYVTPTDDDWKHLTTKGLTETIVESETWVHSTDKVLGPNYLIDLITLDTNTATIVVPTRPFMDIDKPLGSQPMWFGGDGNENTKVAPTDQDTVYLETDKYIEDPYVTNPLTGFVESGYVVVNPYEEGGYFLEVYVNQRNSSF